MATFVVETLDKGDVQEGHPVTDNHDIGAQVLTRQLFQGRLAHPRQNPG